MTQRQNQNQQKKQKQDWQAKSAKKATCRGGEAWRTFCPPPSPLPWTWRHCSIFPLLLLLLPLQHFSLRTPLARNDRNPKTFQKERDRDRFTGLLQRGSLHRASNRAFAEPEANAETYTEPEPDPEPYSEPFAHSRTFRRSLNPSLLPCLSHLTTLFRALANFRASGSETQFCLSETRKVCKVTNTTFFFFLNLKINFPNCFFF
jgi:hypothetical protein